MILSFSPALILVDPVPSHLGGQLVGNGNSLFQFRVSVFQDAEFLVKLNGESVGFLRVGHECLG